MMRLRLWLLLLIAVVSLQAQTTYEKEFLQLVEEKIKDGNISSVSKVSCTKGDCFVKDLVLTNTDMETQKKSKLEIASLKLYNVKAFLEFKQGNSDLKKDEGRHFSIALKDIREDGHNLFFEKKEMAEAFGRKSEQYRYFQKYLDTPSDADYLVTLKNEGKDTVIKDEGSLRTGKISISFKTRYTIKEGLKKLQESAEQNSMGMLAFIVINNIDIKIENPKGFLKNLIYINYKSDMSKVKGDEAHQSVNTSYGLLGSKVYTQKELTTSLLKQMHSTITETSKKDLVFDALLNKNNQLEKKLEAILKGTSRHVYIKIENPKSMSLADFFTLFMGYAMQQKLIMDPGLKVSIK